MEKAPLLDALSQTSSESSKTAYMSMINVTPFVSENDDVKLLEQGIEERRLEATVRRIQRTFLRKCLRKKFSYLKLKSTDEGAGDLVPWSFQLARYLYFPDSNFNDPSMMNSINGELFGICILVCLILTFILDPGTFSDNPLRSRLGYNNVCVALDQRPMRELAAISYTFVHWTAVQYAMGSIGRIRMERRTGKLKRQPVWLDSVLIAMHTAALFGSATFILCFVNSPDMDVYSHTRPFFAYIIGKVFAAAALTIEADFEQDPSLKARRMVTWKTWTYVVVLAVWSSVLMANAELNYEKYDRVVGTAPWKSGDPISPDLFSPWWVSFSLDWGWMFLIGCGSIYLPRAPMTMGEVLIHQDTLNSLRKIFPSKQKSGSKKADPTSRFQPVDDMPLRRRVRAALAYTIEAFGRKGDDEIQKDPSSLSDWGYGRTVTVMQARLTIDDRIKGLSPIFRTGLFEKPGSYDGFVRINITEHGAARFSIRIFVPDTVGGPLLSDADQDTSRPGFKQVDFLMAEGFKQFFVKDIIVLSSLMQTVYGFWSSLKLLLTPIQTFMAIQGILKAKAGIDNTKGVFGKEYYAGLPFLLGPGACKWGLTPRQEHLVDAANIPGGAPKANLTGIEPEVTNKAAQAMLDDLKRFGMGAREWDFVMQTAKCHPTHDLNDGACEWDEKCSSYMPFGTFTIFPEAAHEGGILNEQGPPLNFNAWNQLNEHRPLGPLQLARLHVYRRHRMARLAQPHLGKQPDLVCPLMNVLGRLGRLAGSGV